MFDKKAKLHNGEIVREGSLVSFVNSDNEKLYGEIVKKSYTSKAGKKGSLCFWNSEFKITDYKSAKLEKY